MKFNSTPLSGCYEIEMTPIGDDRGYFMRTFCANEFRDAGLPAHFVQSSISYNQERGTTRALHFQAHPSMEDRLVRCLAGSIFDVAVDMRVGSPTFGQWHGATLTAENNLQLFIPKGFAHGFQTLTDNSVVSYQMAQFFDPALVQGVLWNDPQIGIEWPLDPINQSPRDLTLPLLCDVDHALLLPFEQAGNEQSAVT
jgi:dTDP-4-dehydrorhamnose 3,5-epimerase